MLSAGIDAGSRAIKIVFRDSGDGSVLVSGLADQGVAQDALAGDLYDRLLRENGMTREDVGRTVATGYGRDRIAFADTTITEISCHARGARHLVPDVRTVIDIGGQDSKVIRMNGNGSVRDFVMNDRCAAGTGRFLEVVASRLELDLSELGAIAAGSTRPAAISSMCVVFAETEIVGLLASGVPPEDIVAGVLSSIAKRVSGMAGGKVESPVLLTGGVALVPGFAAAVGSVMGVEVAVPPEPQFAGALGASILAASLE